MLYITYMCVRQNVNLIEHLTSSLLEIQTIEELVKDTGREHTISQLWNWEILQDKRLSWTNKWQRKKLERELLHIERVLRACHPNVVCWILT